MRPVLSVVTRFGLLSASSGTACALIKQWSDQSGWHFKLAQCFSFRITFIARKRYYR
jgi:hypothetical protein